jgi:DNA-binding MarR family transcriptional regulator
MPTGAANKRSRPAKAAAQTLEPPAHNFPPTLLDETWGNFYRAFKLVNELVEKDMENTYHLSLPLLEMMFRIDKAPEGIRLLDIARSLVTSPSSVTRSMDKLVNDKYVRRRESKEDRRETLATLTPKGKEALAKGMKLLHDSRDTHFTPAFSGDELTTFNNILRRLSEAAEAANKAEASS